jgi:hypothetical protein
MNKLFWVLNMLLIFSWISSASPQSWIKVPEIDSTDVLSIMEHDGSLYATTSNQVFKNSDLGDNWQPTNAQPNTPADYYSLFSNNDYIYLGTLGGGIFRSGDQGQSWQSFNTGLPGSAMSIIGFAGLGDSLYAGTNSNGVYVYNLQNPSTWSVFNTGLFQLGVNSIIISGNNIVASIGYYLFVRSRTASQWFNVNLDSTGIQRFVFETLPVNQYLFAGTDNGVYRGTLDGQNWERTDIAVFPNQDIVALTANGSRVIAGVSYFGQHWIFTSDNMGVDWDFRAHEFAEAWDLYVSGNRLWAGRSDGLWYYDMDIWTNTENPDLKNPSGFSLHQNYPNPFNPRTEIGFDLPKSSEVTLKIYNVIGEEVTTLVSERLTAGSYSYEWDASKLASGVYLYRLQAGNYVETRKMVLMK